MNQHGLSNILRISVYDSRKLFFAFLIVIIALQVDIGISTVADIVSKQTITFWGILAFTVVAAVYVVGQFVVLGMVKAKNNDSKIRSGETNKVENITTIVQYILTAIMIFVVLQILLISEYYTQLLSVATAISYGLAIFLMSLLAYRFFSWFKRNRSLVVLLYSLAAAAITVNAIDTIIYYDVILVGKPPLVSPQSKVIFQTGFMPGTAMYVVNLVQTYSLNGYLLLIWGGTILLLRHHMQRVGKVKFWILITLPIVFFLSYELSLYQQLYPNSPVTTALSSNLLLPGLLYVYAGNFTGVLFGIGFWSISRGIGQYSHVRDYMIITAYGFIFYITAGGAAVLQAGYPPFGLANVSLVGLASFLILTGLYRSAISVAQDEKLRQSIKASTILQSSKLLDNIGTAEMTKQIEERVMKITKENAFELKEQSGVEPSLTDDEIKTYLDKVIAEVKKKPAD